jgi:hypothetical protein
MLEFVAPPVRLLVTRLFLTIQSLLVEAPPMVSVIRRLYVYSDFYEKDVSLTFASPSCSWLKEYY